MKRALPLAILAALGVGATALAAQSDNPYDTPEPAVTAAQLLKLPDSAPGCDATAGPRSASAAHRRDLRLLRGVVDGRRPPGSPGSRGLQRDRRAARAGGSRVRVEGETLGGQRVRAPHLPPLPHAPGPPDGARRPGPDGGGED